ncbi:MAG: HAD family phosphatase [Candidatus Nanopelagicales bacterium]
MRKLEAVLFDMDGTLVETESLWKLSERTTMQKFGQPWTREDEIDATGGPFERVAQIMADRAGVQVDEINAVLDETIQDLFRNRPIELQPGVAQLIDELEQAGIPIALVSNSYRALVDIINSRIDVEFVLTVAGDEVEIPKPDPGPYLTAADSLDVDIKNCIVIEDSEPGIASAIASGAAVVAIPGHNDVPDAPRIQVIQSIEELSVGALENLVTGN